MKILKIFTILSLVLLGGAGVVVFADSGKPVPEAEVRATVVTDPPKNATVVPVSSDRFKETPSLREAVREAVAAENGTGSDRVNSKSELESLESKLNKDIRYTTANKTSHYYVSVNETVVKVEVWQLV